MSDIIKQLKEIRKGERLSQDALAAALGMNSQSGISALERGIRSPTLFTLTCWADALGYELALRPKG